MKKLTLRKKFLIVFLSAGAVVAALTGVSVGTMNKLAGNYADIINGNYSIASEAAEMNRNTEAIEKYILAAIASEDEELAANYLDMAQTELDALKAHYDNLYAQGTVSSELLDPIGEFVNTDMQVQKTMFSSIRGGRYNIARNMFFSEYRTALENVNISVNNLSSVMNSSSIVWAKTAEISHFNSRRVCLILCLVCISILTFAGLYLEKALPDEKKQRQNIPEKPLPVYDADTSGISAAEEEARDRLERANLELEQANRELSETNDRLINTRLELEKADDRLEKLHSDIENAERELDIRNTQIQSIDMRISAKESELEDANSRLCEKESELEDAQNKLYEKASQLEKAQAAIESAADEAERKRAEQKSFSSLAAKDAARCIDALADGDRSVSPLADYTGSEELLSAVNKMKAYLCGISMQLGRTAEFILSESQRASRSREDIMESIKETSGYFNDMSLALNSLSESVSRADSISEGIKRSRSESEQRRSKVFGAVSIAKRFSEDTAKSYSEITGIAETVAEIASGANVLAVNSALAAAKAMAGDPRSFAAAADESRSLAMKAAKASGSVSEITGRFGERLKTCSELIAKAAEIAAGSLPEDKSVQQLSELKELLAGHADDIGRAANEIRAAALSETSADAWGSAARTLKEQAAALAHTAGRDK